MEKDFKNRYYEEVESHALTKRKLFFLEEENNELKKRLRVVDKRCAKLEQDLEWAVVEAVEQVSVKFEAIIEAQNQKIAALSSILGNDGNNSGTPTSQTPINKDKGIPNSRIKTRKPKGGQRGHQKHTLSPFEDVEVTHHEHHD